MIVQPEIVFFKRWKNDGKSYLPDPTAAPQMRFSLRKHWTLRQPWFRQFSAQPPTRWRLAAASPSAASRVAMAGHGCHEKELLKAVWGQFGGGTSLPEKNAINEKYLKKTGFSVRCVRLPTLNSSIKVRLFSLTSARTPLSKLHHLQCRLSASTHRGQLGSIWPNFFGPTTRRSSHQPGRCQTRGKTIASEL